MTDEWFHDPNCLAARTGDPERCTCKLGEIKQLHAHVLALTAERRGDCDDCSETPAGRIGGFRRIGEYRCYYCRSWFCADHAFAHFDDHDKGQQKQIAALTAEKQQLRDALDVMAMEAADAYAKLALANTRLETAEAKEQS